jgi:hypothetical protein
MARRNFMKLNFVQKERGCYSRFNHVEKYGTSETDIIIHRETDKDQQRRTFMKRIRICFVAGLLLASVLGLGTSAPAAPVKLEVLSPVGAADIKLVEFAPRVSSLEGKKIGLIWNHKPGGQYLLDELEKQIAAKYKGVTFVRMESEQGMSAEEMTAVLKAAPRVDVVIHSVGD